MTWLIRPLTAADVHPYKSLRDESLYCAPEAFTADHAASVKRPANAYARALAPPHRAISFWAPSTLPASCWAALAANASCYRSSGTAPVWSA
ncbi:hypothetical protein [Acidovorax carolinensis]|uniref:hypothetical protein n=1 Tax=Acidovorax carolinensis TaxID=553814 RepID=UPI003002F386